MKTMFSALAPGDSRRRGKSDHDDRMISSLTDQQQHMSAVAVAPGS